MKNIWLIGDPHGDYTVIHNFYIKHKDELSENYEDNILIILGDAGFNYYLNKRDDFVKNKISKYPLTYFCIRGNHEEQIEGNSVLVVPGAYSVDKWYRIQRGWSWFKDEQLSEEEKQELLEYLEPEYDYILAHTCPYMWIPYIQDLFLPQVDQSMVDKSTEIFLNEIVACVEYKRFYFGHYHDNRDLHEFATMIYHEAIPFGSSYSEENLKNYKNML